jgi:lipase chaperone LimK
VKRSHVVLAALAAFATLLGMATGFNAGVKHQPAGAQAGRPASTLSARAGIGGIGAAPSIPATAFAAPGSALYSQGSLRGAEPDGVLAADASGRLLVSRSVRHRFDHLLSASGELSSDQITDVLRTQAFAKLPAPAFDQLMDLWQRYLRLQGHRFEHGVDAVDAASVSTALEERSRVRRQLLGPAWADAFFGAEERALREHSARALSGLTPALDDAPATTMPRISQQPSAGDDLHALHLSRVAALGPHVAGKLRELDREQADWDRRLAQARSHINGLERDSATLLPAKRMAINHYLAEHFNGHELIRARALLHPELQ